MKQLNEEIVQPPYGSVADFAPRVSWNTPKDAAGFVEYYEGRPEAIGLDSTEQPVRGTILVLGRLTLALSS